MIRFKSERISTEFLHRLDPRLRAIALETAVWLRNQELPVDLVVTCVNRTPDENKADGGKPTSAHLVGRAIDIRTRDWPDGTTEKVMARLYRLWPGTCLYLLHHDVGGGMHLHAQIKMKYHLTDFACGDDRENNLLSREGE